MPDSPFFGSGVRTFLDSKQTSFVSDNTEQPIFAALGAHVVSDLYLLAIMNRSAVDSDVTIRDDTGGLVRWKGTVKAGQQAGFALPPTGALKQTAANKPWTAQCGTAVNSIEITAAFVKNTG